MNTGLIEQLAGMRLAVGYLGEQRRWWGSNFLSPSAGAFLGPVAPRSLLLAQYHGVRQAAARVHDEHVGLGNVYHLFRLPEDTEQDLHSYVIKGGIAAGSRLFASAEAAISYLDSVRCPAIGSGTRCAKLWVVLLLRMAC